MEQERFFRFTRLIDGAHKSILRLRLDKAADFGVKGVHVFWVYELLQHPEGLSAAELAQRSQIDRSLISREISALKKDGYIAAKDKGLAHNYKAKLILTEKGVKAAKEIASLGVQIQNRASANIPEAELEQFYATLEKLCKNLEEISEEV